MTSMPASRSARAMIFAPRSCPSRPGLATTTRIFDAVISDRSHERDDGPERLGRKRSWPPRPACAVGAPGHRWTPRQASEDGGLGVAAPDLLERLDDLTLGGACARDFNQARHEIAVARCGFAQRAERMLDRGA